MEQQENKFLKTSIEYINALSNVLKETKAKNKLMLVVIVDDDLKDEYGTDTGVSYTLCKNSKKLLTKAITAVFTKEQTKDIAKKTLVSLIKEDSTLLSDVLPQLTVSCDTAEQSNDKTVIVQVEENKDKEPIITKVIEETEEQKIDNLLNKIRTCPGYKEVLKKAFTKLTWREGIYLTTGFKG